jgi:hypothetical protein
MNAKNAVYRIAPKTTRDIYKTAVDAAMLVATAKVDSQLRAPHLNDSRLEQLACCIRLHLRQYTVESL